MYKKFAAAVTAAVMAFGALPAVGFAEADIPVTGEDIKEMAWSHTLDKEEDCEEILALEYSDESDLNGETIKLGDLIDPSKSIYDGINKEEDWDYAVWLCADKNDSDVYYDIILNRDENGGMKIVDISDFSDFVPYWFNNDEWFDKAADAVNANLDGTVKDVYMEQLHLKFQTDSGSYILFRSEDTTKAKPAEGFINIDDRTLLAEENAYKSYEEENNVLGKQWFKEANEKMRAVLPELRYETEEGSGVYDKEEVTDSLAAYAGAKSIYDDVSDEYAPYINCLADMGIMNGTGDNEFSPDRIVTRAEMAAVMSRAFKLENADSSLFTDVPEDFWAAGDINAFGAIGVFEGSGDGTFRPNDAVTYDELFKTVVLMMGYGMDYYAMPSDRNYPYGTNNTAISFGFADNLESFQTTDGVTRLNLSIVLCNMLDTRLYTTELIIGMLNPGLMTAQHRDITLAEYLSGTPIEYGFLVRGLAEYEEYNEYKSQMRKKVSSIMSELNEKLSERYFMSGWIRTGYEEGGDGGSSAGIRTAGSGGYGAEPAASGSLPSSENEENGSSEKTSASENENNSGIHEGGASHSSGIIKTD